MPMKELQAAITRLTTVAEVLRDPTAVALCRREDLLLVLEAANERLPVVLQKPDPSG